MLPHRFFLSARVFRPLRRHKRAPFHAHYWSFSSFWVRRLLPLNTDLCVDCHGDGKRFKAPRLLAHPWWQEKKGNKKNLRQKDNLTYAAAYTWPDCSVERMFQTLFVNPASLGANWGLEGVETYIHVVLWLNLFHVPTNTWLILHPSPS